MSRVTRYMVYVDKDIMEKPSDLFDAVITHFIKKEMDIRDRKRFMVEFLHAPTDDEKLKVIDAWVEIRDVATFPFRREEPRKEQDEDQGTEGGVSVDDESDGDQDAGDTPDGGDTQSGPDDAGDDGDTD